MTRPWSGGVRTRKIVLQTASQMPNRATMYLLLSGQNLGNHLIRSSLPMLVPFITQDLGCSSAESALLLGSFFPGCKLNPPAVLPPADEP